MKIRLIVIALLVAPLLARADIGPRPYPSVRYAHETISGEKPQKIYVAAIDLGNPLVNVRVAPGGEDPDGDGKWQTTLMNPTAIADREGFDVVINGDFFAAEKGYATGVAALVLGPAVSAGKLWGPTTQPRSSFLLDRHKRPAIADVQDPPPEAHEVIAGSHVIVKGGKNIAPPPTTGFLRANPRTAIGIAEGGKILLLVVVDGRKPGEATGMSMVELAELMIKYGAHDAVNLDGGGSSLLAIRDPKTGKMHILNGTTTGSRYQRPVANVLGVTVTKRNAATTPPAR